MMHFHSLTLSLRIVETHEYGESRYTQQKKKVNTYCTLIISYTNPINSQWHIYQIKEKFLSYKDI